MTMLERAIKLAVEAHAGRTDKAGQPYILHPLRVMLALPQDDEAVRCAGVLHDVVEDTGTDLAAIARETNGDVARIVRTLTRRADETYTQYIRNISYQRARLVKIADIEDNLSRIDGVRDPGDREFLRKRYTRALESLRAAEAAAMPPTQ